MASPKFACPCDDSRAYVDCCGPLHAGAAAADAEALMRSRYSAYALGLGAYLRATWAAETRPAPSELDVESDEAMRAKWLGLKVHAHELTGTDTAEVEFTARFRIRGGSAQRMRECSRFRREADGRWYYIDGDVDDAS